MEPRIGKAYLCELDRSHDRHALKLTKLENVLAAVEEMLPLKDWDIDNEKFAMFMVYLDEEIEETLLKVGNLRKTIEIEAKRQGLENEYRTDL